MPNGIQIDVAELAGVAVEGVLYGGIFLVMDVVALYILVRHSNYRRSMNRPMILAAVIMLLLRLLNLQSTPQTSSWVHKYSGSTQRLAFLSNLTNPIFAAKHAIYFTMMVVGDAIVITDVTWYGVKADVVLFPILCSLGSAACAYQTIWAIRHPNPDLVLEFNMGYPIFALSFSANAISTCLIAYKIWKADQQFKQVSSRTFSTRRSLFPVARIIIESGAINTAYLLAYTIVLRSGSNGIEIMASIVTPLVGIIFAMVIIRAALAADREAANAKNPAPSRPTFAQPTSTTSAQGGIHWTVNTTTEVSSAGTMADSPKQFEMVKLPVV
ncbi:hypothetical protein BD779DRAFT_1676574 [Infundibulicybe gibba]|nr:hypothetical protein BD779DRAFT_1676574 [Infundibulicybe gibba]